VTGFQEAAIGHEQRAAEPDVRGEVAQARDGALSENDPRPRLEIERKHLK
jgi:hypothetical protein